MTVTWPDFIKLASPSPEHPARRLGDFVQTDPKKIGNIQEHYTASLRVSNISQSIGDSVEGEGTTFTFQPTLSLAIPG